VSRKKEKVEQFSLDSFEREILNLRRQEAGKTKGRPSNEEIAEAKELAQNFRMTQAQMEEARLQRKGRIDGLIDKRKALDEVKACKELRDYMHRNKRDAVDTVKRMVLFVRALADLGTYGHASDRSGVGMAERKFYERHCTAFREALMEANESFTEDLEYMGHLKAFEGNATMIMFFLRARKPHVYRDRVDVENNIHGGKSVSGGTQKGDS